MHQLPPSNAEVAAALRELALYLEADEVPFKPRAYEKAAQVVGAQNRPLSEVLATEGTKGIEALPGIGKGIAARIATMLESGTIPDLEALKSRYPLNLRELTAIEGVGVKKARALWEALGVRTVAELRRVASEGKIRDLPHFGQQSERRIVEALAQHEEDSARRPIGEVLELAHTLESVLMGADDVEQVAIAGSIRRRRDTIGDLDILVATAAPAAISELFSALPEVQAVLAQGPTKTQVRLQNGMNADLRVVEPQSFGAALLYFTGSKAHNVAVRKLAIERKLKLNEYGLFRGKVAIAGRTEEGVYAALGLDWIPPELREDKGEVERAQAGRLPILIEAADIRGDLQVHTDWTDGSSSIEEMARAASELGRKYIVITDHTHDLAMTGGLDKSKLRAQIKEIRRVDQELPGIRVLAGAEVNVRPDGTLDIDDTTLAQLDLVGAAIHSHFGQSRAEMTARIIRAVSNPNVHVLFHPLNRALGRRRAVDCDFAAVLEACREHGTILEVDAQPERLDLPGELVREAIEAGVRIAIDSDAHSPKQLRFIETFGLSVARRGWAERESVVNTFPVDELLAVLGKARPRRDRARAAAAGRNR